MVPISVAEAGRAALDLPLAFTRKQDNTLSLMAILSLEQNSNAHVGPKGLWMGGYMPAVIQAYPFSMAVQGGQATVMVDMKSDWVSFTEGQQLFEGNGNPGDLLNRITTLMQQKMPNPNRDDPVLEIVENSGLLIPWSEVSKNLLTIDMHQMVRMPESDFAGLRNRGALAVIYAHLMSLPRINRIKHLAQRKQKMTEHLQKNTGDFHLEDDSGYDLGTMIG
jgi:hypothetical protein